MKRKTATPEGYAGEVSEDPRGRMVCERKMK